jgi:DNA-binding transcriptional LysR family regulator
LEQVLAIIECGSFSQAAKKLFISQPSLSESIKKLEKHLKTTLLDRSSNPIRLTYAGELYVETAIRIMEISEELEQKLNDEGNIPQGEVVVGSSQFTTTYIMPHILTFLRKRFPKIRVSLLELPGQDREEASLRGSIHLFFTTMQVNNKYLEQIPLFKERILIALPKTHVLNEKDAISRQERMILPTIRASSYPLKDLSPECDFPRMRLEKLMDDDFVLLKSSLSLPGMVRYMFDETGFTPKVVLESQSIAATHAMAAAGLGNAFVPESLIRYNDYCSQPVLYQIEPFLPSRNLFIVYNKRRYCSKAMIEFINASRRVLNAPVTSS